MVRQYRNRSMGNGNAGTEHQESQVRTGDRHFSGRIVNRNGPGILVDFAVFEVKVTPAVPKFREHMKVLNPQQDYPSLKTLVGARERRPKPKALADPMPRTTV